MQISPQMTPFLSLVFILSPFLTIFYGHPLYSLITPHRGSLINTFRHLIICQALQILSRTMAEQMKFLINFSLFLYCMISCIQNIHASHVIIETQYGQLKGNSKVYRGMLYIFFILINMYIYVFFIL